MQTRDVFRSVSPNQSLLHDGSNTSNNWLTGITADYRSYNPSSSKYSSVATTRSGNFDPQRGLSNFYGTGRYSSDQHFLANSSQIAAATANRISYLSPSGSRPSAYHWGQNYTYADPTKAAFVNQYSTGLNLYRFSDGNKVILDQIKNLDQHWLYYNHVNFDNNLLTLSNSGVVSKIESTSYHLDNTANPTTPLLFQTHGGIGANDGGAMATDYPRDSFMQASDRDSYVIYQPNFGSNAQIPTNVELEGEWMSNSTGGRSGS